MAIAWRSGSDRRAAPVDLIQNLLAALGQHGLGHARAQIQGRMRFGGRFLTNDPLAAEVGHKAGQGDPGPGKGRESGDGHLAAAVQTKKK